MMEHKDNNNIVKKYYLYILLISILGIYLRLEVGTATTTYEDTGYMIAAGQNKVAGTVNLPVKNYSIPVKQISSMLFDSENGKMIFRIFSVLTGLLSVYIFYLFAAGLMGNKITGLFSALILFLSPLHIYLSRLSSFDITAFTLFILSLYFLIMAKEKKYAVYPAVIIYFISVLFDINLIIYIILIIPVLFIIKRNSALIPVIILLGVFAVYFIFADKAYFDSAENLFRRNNPVAFTFQIMEFMQFLLIYVLLIVAAHNYKFRLDIDSKLFLYAVLFALPVPLIVLINGEYYTIVPASLYALIFLIPPGAALLKQFLYINKKFRIAVLALFIGLMFLAYYQSAQIVKAHTLNINKESNLAGFRQNSLPGDQELF